MAGYNLRRSPNVSQYIANLNAIPSAQEIEAQHNENFNLEDDLAMFTNAEFFHFDLGQNVEQVGVNYDPVQEGRSKRGGNSTEDEHGNVTGMDLNNGSYSFPELDPYLAATSPQNPHPLQPIQTAFPQIPFDPNTFQSPNSPSSPTPSQVPVKRAYNSASPSIAASTPNLEASSRAAADEDKRRRNTAASARFRVKKKQREQALEKTAKEMTDRADALESRISQLEMENKWLRNLIVEKSATGNDDVSDMWKKFSAEHDERKPETKKKGVGTEVVGEKEKE